MQPEGGNVSVYSYEQYNNPVASGGSAPDGSTIYMKAVANPDRVVDGFLINGIRVFTNRYMVNSNISVSANFIDSKPWNSTSTSFDDIHGGDGSVEHPYHIDIPEHLATVANEGNNY